MSAELPAAEPRRRASERAVVPQPRGFPDDHPFFVATQWVVAGALHLLAGITVEGMERCPPKGPVVLAANHLNIADIPLTGAWCPRTVIYFSKMEVRRWPVVGAIGAGYGTIFVRRGESDRVALRETLACLAAGQVLGVFPEGHRSRGQGLLRGQPGIGFLAQRSGAPVWPVAITGTEHIGKRLRPRVTLRGGEPFDPIAAARAEHGPSVSHQDVADTIMRRIAALLPESYRGVYR